MTQEILSLLRVSLTYPSGDSYAELLLLDWSQHGNIPVFPWTQQAKIQPLLYAGQPNIEAAGNITGPITVEAVHVFDTAAEFIAHVYDRPSLDLGYIGGHEAELRVRLVDPSATWDPEATAEAILDARTARQWRASPVVLTSATPTADPARLAVLWTYQLVVGNLIEGAPPS
jgi:hypothetical protein